MKSKHNFKNIMLCIIGAIIYTLAINIFIIPTELYSGGFIGIAQLISLFVNKFIEVNFNLQGLIYFILNIPIFIIGYKILGKGLIFTSLFLVILESTFLSFIPVLKEPLIDNILTSSIIGGCMQGVGCTLTFIGFGSGGGTDCLGLILSKTTRNITVGKCSLFVNACVYLICAYLFSFEIAIYSLIASIFCSFVIDKFHLQNNNVSVNILTTKPEDIQNYIINSLNRDATILNAIGGYSHQDKKLLICIMSEYELNEFKKEVKNIDENAFIFIHPGITILGNYEKRIS